MEREEELAGTASLGCCLSVEREEGLAGAASLLGCCMSGVERENGLAGAASLDGYLSVEREKRGSQALTRSRFV